MLYWSQQLGVLRLSVEVAGHEIFTRCDLSAAAVERCRCGYTYRYT